MVQTLRGRRGTPRDQKQPTEGCTNEEVAFYETYDFDVGASRTDGGDGG
jgi:hypothetical protein